MGSVLSAPLFPCPVTNHTLPIGNLFFFFFFFLPIWPKDTFLFFFFPFYVIEGRQTLCLLFATWEETITHWLSVSLGPTTGRRINRCALKCQHVPEQKQTRTPCWEVLELPSSCDDPRDPLEPESGPQSSVCLGQNKADLHFETVSAMMMS